MGFSFERLKDVELDNYRVIVMEEANERSLTTDVLVGILKKVVAQRLDFKLIDFCYTKCSKKFEFLWKLSSVPSYSLYSWEDKSFHFQCFFLNNCYVIIFFIKLLTSFSSPYFTHTSFTSNVLNAKECLPCLNIFIPAMATFGST